MSSDAGSESGESLEGDLQYVMQLQSTGEQIYDALTDDDKVTGRYSSNTGPFKSMSLCKSFMILFKSW